MAGYSRQSAASIVPTAVVRATPLNDEFNTLRDAFVVATGHKHDGTSTEGAYVPLISDTNARNKVVVDSANNRISLFINVSSAAVEQLRLIDGAILPVTDNDIDLGSSTFEFKDLFIDGTANIDSLVADTAAISGGTINSTVIGGTTPAAGTFTTVSATVSATISSATISGGTINNTVIGATTPAAGTFTNLTVNTAATIASAAISAGTINNTVIGGTTPQAVTGTTITANTGFVGALTGNVTGNVTASSGTSTFNNATVNGTLSATLTGNVNASSGTSTFNNVTISGTLNMDGATAATITNLSTPVNTGDAATKGYVDTAISNLIDTAPGTLDTLNELAAALGDDPNFATTVTNSIATKLSLSGGTMTGAIAMGTNKITGMGDPTNAQDAATKTYVDTQRDTRLALSGGTMSGAIAMGTNKITGLGDPTSNQDAATKIYVDGILGSATSAAASAAAAATSASNAATSASNASTSATNAASSASAAAASAAAAAASYDSFDDRYLGVKTSDPSLDNDGNALVTGAIYFNSTAGEMRVWTGSAWASTLLTTGAQTFTGVKTFASNPILDAGTANGVAYLNGSKVLTTGSALTFDGTYFTVGASSTTGDYKAFIQKAGGELLGLNASSGTLARIAFGNATATFGSTQIIANAADLAFITSSAEQMRLTSTGLGIGTSSPAYKLDVVSNAATWAARVYNNNANNGLLVSTSSTSSSIGSFACFNGTAYTFFVRDDGNVGIGTSSPANKLHVQTSTTGDGIGARISTSDASGVGSQAINLGGYLGGNQGVALKAHYNYGATNATSMSFWTTNAAGTQNEGMRLDSSGNLGIGTSSPAVKLQSNVSRTSGQNVTALVLSDTVTGAQTSGFGTQIQGWSNNGSAQSAIGFEAYGGTNNDTALGFYTQTSAGGLTRRMTISSTGDVGIGTGSPATKLHISGSTTPNLRFEQTNSSVVHQFQAASGNFFLNIDATNAIGGSIFLIQQAGSTVATLDSSGNLGLGVTPSGYLANKFVINTGTDSNNGITIASATNRNGSIWFADGTTGDQAYRGGVDYQHTNDTLYLYSGGQGNFQLTAAGNIGLVVTPSAWRSGTPAFQIGSAGVCLFADSGITAELSNNVFLNSSSQYIYLRTDAASRYKQYQGVHSWLTAGSGTAGTQIGFSTVMTLDASGNWMTGTTTAIGRATVVGGTSQLAFHDGNGSNTNYGLLNYGGSSGELTLNANSTGGNTLIRFLTSNSGSNAERARITSGGDLLVGKTSYGSVVGTGCQLGAAGAAIFTANNDAPLYLSRVSTDGRIADFYRDNTQVGSISVTTTATAYNTSSDYRLKDNPQPLTGSGAFIDALQPKTWNWTADGSRGVGFIAHEVQEVSPGSVVGTKDAVDEEGKPIMQAMEYGSAEFIANIIAELQSLRARVAQLEAK